MTMSLSPLQKAFLALQDAEARIAELEAARGAPIAVIGLGCRAPGGVVDGDSFWRLLEDGRDATGPVPADRWDHEALYDPDPETPGRIVTRNGGFLERIDAFDPEFFGITPREAAGMDPQQRMVLEVCWEALENAGQSPKGLEGSATGVFIGAAASDYAYLQLQAGDPNLLDAHFASGMAHSVLSGRVAYLLGLQGPALTIDTACSSSLVAVHTACQSLRARDCRLALAGGVNLILSPDIFIALSRARMLAPDGRCKTFDAAADGFARGEGCAIVALKRLSDAVADGDRVLAVIRGAAVNQDGPSSGLTAPNGTAQEAVIRAALDHANLTPDAVGYIEAHGTGTELGDPLEARALGAVFASGRSQPLLIGSVKTNLGHLEGAAGVIGLVKTILSLRHGVVPAHLHLTKPSAHIAWEDLNLTVSPKAVAFPEINGRRIAGVSSFGFSGTNAHVIIEAPPEGPAREIPARAWALPLSAPDARRLSELATAVSQAITPETRLADITRTLATGRAHLAERAVVRAENPAAAKAGFEFLAKGIEAPNVVRARLEAHDPPRTAFLFTGQGSQCIGMGAALYATAPAYRAAFDECDALLEPLLGRSIKSIVFEPGDAEALDQTGYAQPALFAFEYALAAFWQRLGVQPVAALGHSVGEYVAACVSGAMTLEDAVTLIAARARLMQSLPAGGAMAAVFAPEARAAELLGRLNGELSLAAVNGPAQVVVSGSAAAVQRLCAEAEAAGIKTRALPVSHAFHSPLMDPILDAFEREAGKITVRAPSMQLISNLTGRAANVREISAPAYWRRHLRSPVRFAEGLATLAQAKIDICLEIGPQPTLTSFAAAVFNDGDGPTLIPSQRRGGDGWEQILDAVARLHLAGVDLDWSALDSEKLGVPIDLPLTPFKRERHWFQTGNVRATKRSGSGVSHAMLGTRQRSAAAEAVWELHSEDAPAWVDEHRVLDRVIAPGAMLIEMMRLASGGQSLSDIALSEALEIDRFTPRIVQTITADEDGVGQVFVASLDDEVDPAARWRRHASAAVGAPAPQPAADLAGARAACPVAVDAAAYYASFAPRGFDFGPSFHSIHALWKGEGQAFGEVKITADLASGAPPDAIHPVLLDGCLQVAGAALPAEAASQVLLPVALAGYYVAKPLQAAARVHAKATAVGDGYRADIAIFDEMGALAAALTGVRFVRTSRAALAARGTRDLEQSFYAVNWREADPAPPDGPDVASLAELAVAKAPGLAEAVAFEAHECALARVETLATPIILRALHELGWTPGVGDRVDAEELAATLGVAVRHRRLFRRLLQILGETGVLQADGAGWRVVTALPPALDAAEELKALARTAPPGAAAMSSMTARVAEGLSAALAGDREPMDLLFPAGATDEAERLYRDSAPAAIFNGMLAEAVAKAAAEGARVGRFEVLEIGAGTGGTTARVIDRLPADNLGYLYTDVGATFVTQARKRFEHDPRMDFATFDLERDIESQGLEAGRYDLIIAANVVHATADLRTSLARIRRLLKPNGLLALMEVVEPQRWFDLTVGLTAGWWAFTDLDIRPDYPTLAAERWRALLAECGFDVAVAQPLALWPSGAREALIFARAKPADDVWAVLSDDEVFAHRLVAEIKSGGGQATAIGGADLREQLAAFDGLMPAGVVIARSPDADKVSAACADLAMLASALAERSPPPRLVVLTRGAQSAGRAGAVTPQQAPFWGVARSLSLESPELRTRVIDLDPAHPVAEAAAIAAELTDRSGETQVALRGGKRLVARLERRASLPGPTRSEPAAWRLTPASPGAYDSFVRAPLVRRRPGAGEVEIETVAWGLNFKDVLNALNLYPGDPGPLGGESAGRIVAVGEGVDHLRVDDEVMAVAGGSFASHVIASAALVQRKPKTMSFEEAASFPIPWLTAAFCLEHLAKLRRGERVLIHAGAGGVGLAAVRIAQRLGAKVFATAGSPWKRDLLKAGGVVHVYDSRTPVFAEQILADTNGEGVQVVLNSLAGEMMDASFRATATGGRFVEIGKNGLKERAWIDALGRDIAYEIVDWGETAEREPQLVGGMLRELVEAAGELPPLPHGVFSVDESGEAFRHMAQARHAGKIVLRLTPSRPAIRPDGTYLVSGGLSGVGLETARWLASKGAGRLVLFGRRGLTPEAEPAVAELRAAGAEVWAERLDVGDRAELEALLIRIRASGFPLRGVIHSAGTLDNAALASHDKRRFDTVFRAKHDGAAALDALTRIDPIEIFVLYSSVASVLGAAGQVNHAAANGYMDALAHQRRSHGLPALSINWGAWSDVGAAAGAAAMTHLSAQGFAAFTPAQGLAALERLLAEGDAQAMVARVDWPAYLDTRSAASVPPFLREFASSVPPRAAAIGATAPAVDSRAEIEAAPVGRRPALITALVTRVAAGVVGFAMDRQIDPRTPLVELGLDSLMAVDLRNQLGRALGHRFPSTLLFDYPAIGGLVEMIGAEVFGLALQEQSKAAVQTPSIQDESDALLDAIEGLDDESLDRLLAARLGMNA
jgi:acyl transferase domain-containing protein/acyl carrier protein